MYKLFSCPIRGFTLLLFSWVLLGFSYLILLFELNIVYLPISLAVLSLLSTSISVIMASISLFKGEFITLNIITLVIVLPTIFILFMFIKAHLFFIGLAG